MENNQCQNIEDGIAKYNITSSDIKKYGYAGLAIRAIRSDDENLVNKLVTGGYLFDLPRSTSYYYVQMNAVENGNLKILHEVLQAETHDIEYLISNAVRSDQESTLPMLYSYGAKVQEEDMELASELGKFDLLDELISEFFSYQSE